MILLTARYYRVNLIDVEAAMISYMLGSIQQFDFRTIAGHARCAGSIADQMTHDIQGCQEDVDILDQNGSREVTMPTRMVSVSSSPD